MFCDVLSNLLSTTWMILSFDRLPFEKSLWITKEMTIVNWRVNYNWTYLRMKREYLIITGHTPSSRNFFMWTRGDTYTVSLTDYPFEVIYVDSILRQPNSKWDFGFGKCYLLASSSLSQRDVFDHRLRRAIQTFRTILIASCSDSLKIWRAIRRQIVNEASINRPIH